MSGLRRLAIVLPLGIPLLVASFLAQEAQEPWRPEVPLGFFPEDLVVPEENPLTPEKVVLGKMLFFDTRLSRDRTVACATCHDPTKAYTDRLTVSIGIERQRVPRNSPTVLNTAFNPFGWQFWDGRVPSLEEQAKQPIIASPEMGFTWEGVVKRLSAIPEYRQHFRTAFGTDEVTIDRVARAIASFERTLLTGDSPWDRYEQGDETALTEAQVRGLELFRGNAACAQCHAGANLTDNIFHNIGVGMDRENSDVGRYAVTGKEEDRGAFKTPTLRNLTLTPPYMHDGSVPTLEEVIEFYDRGGEPTRNLDPKIKPLNLTPQEKADLVAFLEALTGAYPVVERPELPADPRGGRGQ